MSDAADYVLRVIAAPGERGLAMSRVLCALVAEGSKLGELDEREVSGPDGTRMIKVLPDGWFDRLRNAVERGAFERMAEQDIVARILTPLEQAA